MEKSAVITLYKWSVQKHKLYFDPYIGDGDSSLYREVCKLSVYGPTKMIWKDSGHVSHDSSHVIKRMGTQLPGVVRDNKGTNLFDYLSVYHLINYYILPDNLKLAEILLIRF